MVNAEDVIHIIRTLSANNIQAWLTGGWGVDALLREQTRQHKDLDIFIRVDDIVHVQEILRRDGYSLKELWSENKWGMDSRGNSIPTAFVLHDANEREVDIHAIQIDDQGNGIPAWAEEKRIFKREYLAAEGLVAGFAVTCISPEMQVVCHIGYDLPPDHLRDLELLQERFGGGSRND